MKHRLRWNHAFSVNYVRGHWVKFLSARHASIWQGISQGRTVRNESEKRLMADLRLWLACLRTGLTRARNSCIYESRIRWLKTIFVVLISRLLKSNYLHEIPIMNNVFRSKATLILTFSKVSVVHTLINTLFYLLATPKIIIASHLYFLTYFW